MIVALTIVKSISYIDMLLGLIDLTFVILA